MLEFQVDRSLSSREDNLLNGLAARNLIDLRDVLPKGSGKRLRGGCRYTHLTNEPIQEDLTLFMTVRMPFKGVDLAEGVEFLST
jgi:hypothetical protein